MDLLRILIVMFIFPVLNRKSLFWGNWFQIIKAATSAYFTCLILL